MSSEWIRTSIGQQATLQRGFDIIKAEQRVGDVPVVSSSGISSWHDTAMVKGPGVVLGRKGVVGSVHFIQQDFWPHDTSLWVKDFHGNDPRYVYYFFRANAKALSALDVGSANPTLNRNHVHPIEVSWPSSQDEQRAIAGILETLDDRITLLRETNATLEAIAQALFKSWFVDFDPVRAKQEGRAPEGMSDATAALFPDGFEESELGPVPRGWRVAQFADFIERQSVGKKYDQKSAKTMGSVPILDQGKSGIIGFHDDKPGVTASLDEPVVVFANHTCYMRLITFPFSAIQNVLPFKGKGVDTTSNDVLMKILDGQSLRMSARHHLNDTLEGEQFFTLLEKHDTHPDQEKIEAVRQTLAPYEFFVTCFSSERDLLSQWRGYAGNGTGVAIGFRTQAIRAAITGSEEALLYPVTYADDCRCLPKKQENAINAILRSSGNPRKAAVQALVKERWAIKPKGFAEEKEFRLIITLDVRSGCLKPATKGLHIGYFATSSEVREYCEFRFSDFPNDRFVESITLGPNNRTDETVLRRYLASKGLTDVEVLRSGISYR